MRLKKGTLIRKRHKKFKSKQDYNKWYFSQSKVKTRKKELENKYHENKLKVSKKIKKKLSSIDDCRRAIKDLTNCCRLGFECREITGVLGELYVLKKLLELNNVLEYTRGKYDIKLKNNKTVEVKTSKQTNTNTLGLKTSAPSHQWWTTSKNGKRNFDYLICVALNKSYKKPVFYIFSKEELKDFKGIQSRYKKGTPLVIFNDIRMTDIRMTKEIPYFIKQVNKNKLKYKNKWNKLYNH